MSDKRAISDFFNLPLSEVAQGIASGEISSYELVLAYLERIERVNPSLNAFVCIDKKNALDQAKRADLDRLENKPLGILHGIPISIKDNIQVKTLPTTAGYATFKTHISKEDAKLISNLRAAGAIVLGKTNLPALTYDLQTNNVLFGRTNNPWNLDHTPGGSSGGCAAAISSEMSRLSFCNDSGGSIRIPAHFCGIYGFKASFAGIDTTGIITKKGRKPNVLKMRTLLSAGMLARSIEDLTIGLNVVGSKKIHALKKIDAAPATIKLLWIEEFPGFEVDHAIKTALGELRTSLTRKGIQIADFPIEKFDFLEVIRMWGHLSNYETGSELPLFTRSIGNLLMRRKYSKIPMHTDLLKPISIKKYRTLRRRHEAVKKQFESILAAYDGLVLPSASVLSFPHQLPDRKLGHLGIYTTPLMVNGQNVQYAIATQSYAIPFNVLESPVVNIPIALSASKLPIGIQLVGKKLCDFDLLEIAKQVDARIPSIGFPES